MMANNVNPASMFISLFYEDFFSVINRKIIENYKLNLFDITIDPFEFKIGFWENKTINKKDVDLYYGYCSTANMNGYRFLNPANIGNGLSLVSSIYLEKIFNKYSNEYFLNFLFTIYLLNFIFLARVKVFPFDETEKNYNRFIDVLFNFYDLIFEQSTDKIDPWFIEEIKREILWEIDLLFLFFEHFKLINWTFESVDQNDESFYNWIFMMS